MCYFGNASAGLVVVVLVVGALVAAAETVAAVVVVVESFPRAMCLIHGIFQLLVIHAVRRVRPQRLHVTHLSRPFSCQLFTW